MSPLTTPADDDQDPSSAASRRLLSHGCDTLAGRCRPHDPPQSREDGSGSATWRGKPPAPGRLEASPRLTGLPDPRYWFGCSRRVRSPGFAGSSPSPPVVGLASSSPGESSAACSDEVDCTLDPEVSREAEPRRGRRSERREPNRGPIPVDTRISCVRCLPLVFPREAGGQLPWARRV
jgi:hypothetical protein